MCLSIACRSITLPFSVAFSLFAAGAIAQVETVESTMQMGTQLIDQGALANQVISLSDPQNAQRELPGLGHKFELLQGMARDSDPENVTGKSGASGGGVGGNEAISATTAPGIMAFALRNTPPGVKIMAFTNQLGFKHWFVAPKSCFGGSPRITLLVDADGDGNFDFSAHGHVNPPYSGCPTNKWVYQDLADDLPRWEITGAAVPGIVPNVFLPWKTFAAAISAALPNHKVVAGFLLDGESCQFAPSPVTCGKAYYDLVTIENRTLEIWQDTVKK
jgi:hypothetical protein